MVSALIEEVLNERLNFEQLEKLLWNCALGFFRQLMVEVLEEADEKLMKTRDKARFINEEAVTWATKGPSYRDTRDRLTDFYGAQVLTIKPPN